LKILTHVRENDLMAKMHTGGNGKSKSRKPMLKKGQLPEDSTTNKEEILKLINDYAKQKVSPALIGQRLKKKHNVPYIKQLFDKRLEKVLADNGIESKLPSDMLALMKKAVNMREHISSNKNDQHNKLRLTRIESKIWRLSKYYKREGRIPADWKYDPKQAELLIKGE
jgi:small subunit ribosomal protein S15